MKISYTKRIFYLIFTVLAAVTVFIVFFGFGAGIDGNISVDGFSIKDTFSLKYTEFLKNATKLKELYPDNEFFTKIIDYGTNLNNVIDVMKITFYLGIVAIIFSAVSVVLSFTNIFVKSAKGTQTINKTSIGFINAALAFILIGSIVGNVGLWAVIYNSDIMEQARDLVSKAGEKINGKTHGLIDVKASVTPNVKMIVVGIIIPIIGFIFAGVANKFKNSGGIIKAEKQIQND